MDQGSVGYPSWVALCSFLAVAILSLAILWPRPREFAADSTRIIEKCLEGDQPRSVADLHRALTLQMQRSYATNWEDLGQLAILFEVASGLLAIEVIFWIVAIGSSA